VYITVVDSEEFISLYVAEHLFPVQHHGEIDPTSAIMEVRKRVIEGVEVEIIRSGETHVEITAYDVDPIDMAHVVSAIYGTMSNLRALRTLPIE